MKKLLAGLLLMLTSVSTARAAVFVGKGATGSAFLKIPISARPTSLGDAFTAEQGDVSVIDYNPAGLRGLYRIDVTAMYQAYVEDASLQSLAIGFPVDFSRR